MKVGKVLLVLLPLLALVSPSLVNAGTFDLKPPPAEALMAPPLVPSSSLYDVPLMLMLGLIGFSGGLIIWKKNMFKAVTLACLILLSGLMPFAFASYSYGSPLTTAGIGLISYYQHTGFTLADCASGFESYTDHGTYYDGVIRLYIDGSGNTYTGDDNNWLVNCRVRADGWILTWLNATQEDEYVFYDARDADTTSGSVTDYWTSLGRAMNRIFYAASEAFPGYDVLHYYDYSETSATKLVFGVFYIVGNTAGVNNSYGSFMVPSDITVEKAIFIIHARSAYATTKNWYIDGDLIVGGATYPPQNTDWLDSYDIAAYIEYDSANNLKSYTSNTFAYYVTSVILWLS